MQNEEIIDALELTGKLMDLHNENAFKSKAYAAAAFKLNKLRFDFQNKTAQDLSDIEGVGAGIISKIQELITRGSMQELDRLLEKTPTGLLDVMNIKGLGPKKVRQLWQELEIESIGELLYACNENRLVALKGFGDKTQEQVRLNIEFLLSNKDKFHYATVESAVLAFLKEFNARFPTARAAMVGELARKNEIIERIDVLVLGVSQQALSMIDAEMPLPPNFHFCSREQFVLEQVKLSASTEHLAASGIQNIANTSFETEQDLYASLQLQFVPAELREGTTEIELAKQNKIPQLIEPGDLKGSLHNHSTDSDGAHTLKEMADYCRSLGYTYFGICDHSRSAFYANGLDAVRVIDQQKRIDALNANYNDFKILKGIESDILNDGSLDYPEDILKTFDFIVASVHSNLKMTEEKATQRLITAIENPYTSILGHPTGRLLLGRPGYPINHKKVIDACAANKVHIELNAHPYRLDIDWRWIPYCVEKGVMISINPDAHHKEGFGDMYYGVCAARKGMLTKEQCLNALSLEQLLISFKK